MQVNILIATLFLLCSANSLSIKEDSPIATHSDEKCYTIITLIGKEISDLATEIGKRDLPNLVATIAQLSQSFSQLQDCTEKTALTYLAEKITEELGKLTDNTKICLIKHLSEINTLKQVMVKEMFEGDITAIQKGLKGMSHQLYDMWKTC